MSSKWCIHMNRGKWMGDIELFIDCAACGRLCFIPLQTESLKKAAIYFLLYGLADDHPPFTEMTQQPWADDKHCWHLICNLQHTDAEYCSKESTWMRKAMRAAWNPVYRISVTSSQKKNTKPVMTLGGDICEDLKNCGFWKVPSWWDTKRKLSSLSKDQWSEQCHARSAMGCRCSAALVESHSCTQQVPGSFHVKENLE